MIRNKLFGSDSDLFYLLIVNGASVLVSHIQIIANKCKTIATVIFYFIRCFACQYIALVGKQVSC
jgi:hypothetical protein